MTAPSSPIVLSAARRRVAPALRRLNGAAALSEAETRLVERCAERVQEHRVGRALVEEGAPQRPILILTGWACRQRGLSDGRRQIIELLIPGDLIAFSVAPEPRTTSVVALTRLETADAASVKAAALNPEAHPALAQALAANAEQIHARLLDQVVRLGRQTAYERVAHLLIEIAGRLSAAGIGDGRVFPFPPTQQVLADLLGLSIVHINRTLQQLRREKLIELRGGGLVVLDRYGLAAVAGVAASSVSWSVSGGLTS